MDVESLSHGFGIGNTDGQNGGSVDTGHTGQDGGQDDDGQLRAADAADNLGGNIDEEFVSFTSLHDAYHAHDQQAQDHDVGHAADAIHQGTGNAAITQTDDVRQG